MRILSNLLLVSENSRDVTQLLDEKDLSPDSIQRTIETTGISRLSYFPNDDFESILHESRDPLKVHCEQFTDKIKVLLVVSQTNFNRIPNGAAILQKVLNLDEETICFEITEGCNGFVKALYMAESLLAEGEVGAIFGGDFGSQIAQGSDPGTAALFGDGFAFTIVQRTGSFKSLIRNDGTRGNFIKFGLKEPTMFMDGFSVFQFAAKEIPRLVDDYGELKIGEKTIVAFHQASKFVVEQIAKRIGIVNPGYELFNAKYFGNLGPASIPGFIANYGEISFGTKIFCIGFGSGLSWGICEVEWQGIRNEVLYV